MLPFIPLQLHSIWNFRVIPSQLQILVLRVVRALRSQDPDIYLVELFDIPALSGDHSVDSHSARFLQSKDKLLNVQIAELRTKTTANDESIIHQSQGTSHLLRYPSTCVYETGVDHISIWPCARPLPPSPPPSPGSLVKERPQMEYTYSLNDVESRALETRANHGLGLIRAVPGAYRALVYTVPAEHISLPTPTTGLFTYVYEGTRKSTWILRQRQS